MARRALEAQILHNNLTERARFELNADPDDNATLQRALEAWLRGQKWDKGRWAEFEMIVRPAGEGRILKRVRV
jgi:hypothetical protein